MLRIFAAVGHLLCLRRVHPTGAPIAPGVLLALALATLASTVLLDWVATEPPQRFAFGGFGTWGVWVLLLLGLGAVAAREATRPRVAGPLIALLLGVGATLDVVHTAVQLAIGADASFGAVALVWASWLRIALEVLLAARAIDCCTRIGGLRASALAVLYGGLVLGVLPRMDGEFWYTDFGDRAERRFEEPAIDAEALLYGQPARLHRALDALEPERPDEGELFLVSFAADATQGVFRREVELVRALFDQRFDTAGHSLLLVNDDASADDYPIASATNLRDALVELGRRMDREEDVLFLFLTGHGSRDGRVVVSFPRLPLNPVTPARLAQLLDASRIRWQVVIVSACYSGAFLEPLRDDDRLVITASAADRTSFGCSDDADLTEFGRAFFAEALRAETSFPVAFERARGVIAERERRGERTASQPQIALGRNIAAKLERLDQRLRARVVTAAAAR